MYKKTGTLLLLVSAILSYMGCTFQGADEVLFVPRLEAEFRLEMREHLSPTGNRLEVEITTRQAVNCDTANIVADINLIDSKSIQLNIDRVDYASDCRPGTSFGNEVVSPGRLLDNVYDIEVRLQNLVANEGILNILPDRYRLSFFDPVGITVAQTELLRTPPSLVWGMIRYTDDQAAANQAIAELEALGLGRIDLPEGIYTQFRIDNGRLELPGESKTRTLFFYRERLGARLADINKWAEMTRSQTDLFERVGVYTGRGDRF